MTRSQPLSSDTLLSSRELDSLISDVNWNLREWNWQDLTVLAYPEVRNIQASARVQDDTVTITLYWRKDHDTPMNEWVFDRITYALFDTFSNTPEDKPYVDGVFYGQPWLEWLRDTPLPVVVHRMLMANGNQRVNN